MGGTGKNNEPPKKPDDKAEKPLQVPLADDDYEDCDIATARRDDSGNEDRPL